MKLGKGFVVATVAAALVFISSNIYAQGDKGMYIGIGGNYALENFDLDRTPTMDALGLKDWDYDDSPGLNLKAGYQFNRLFAVEFLFDYFFGFDTDQTISIEGHPIKFSAEGELMTFIVAGKLSPDMGSTTVRPYVTAGLGWMDAELDADISSLGYAIQKNTSDSDFCGKVGIGVDFYATKNVSLGIEASYINGFGDVDNIRYTNLNAGVAYHFN